MNTLKPCPFCPDGGDVQLVIAELEAESERFTVHSDIERQDDKWIPEVQE